MVGRSEGSGRRDEEGGERKIGPRRNGETESRDEERMSGRHGRGGLDAKPLRAHVCTISAPLRAAQENGGVKDQEGTGAGVH